MPRRRDKKKSNEGSKDRKYPTISRGLVVTSLSIALAGWFAGTYHRPNPSLPQPDNNAITFPIPYADWYSQVSKETPLPLAHPSFPESDRLDESEKLRLEEILRKNSKDPITILGSKFRKSYALSSVPWNEKTFSEYVQKSQQSIDEFFEYIGIEKLTNTIRFERLNSNSEIFQSGTDRVVFNVAWQGTNHYFGEFKVAIDNPRTSKRRMGTAEITLNERMSYGEANITADLFFAEQGPIFTGIRTEPFLLLAGYGDVSSYTSPPAEAAHIALSNYRGERIASDLREFWKGLNDPSVGIQKDIMNRISTKWHYREEGVIHALLDQFIMEQQARIGLTPIQVEEYVRHTNMESYQLIPLIKEKLKHLKPKEVMRLYLTQPDELFLNTQQ